MPEIPPSVYYSPENDDANKTLYPKLKELITLVNAKKICDYGCGNGRLWHGFNLTNHYISLYDPAMSQLHETLSNLPFKGKMYETSESISNEEFDLVVCSLALMTIPKYSEFISTIKEISRITSKNGKGLFAITHPCFLDRKQEEFETSFVMSNQPFEYLQNGLPFEVKLPTYKGDDLILHDIHRPLNVYFEAFDKFSINVKNFHEIPITDKIGENFPAFLIFETIKT